MADRRYPPHLLARHPLHSSFSTVYFFLSSLFGLDILSLHSERESFLSFFSSVSRSRLQLVLSQLVSLSCMYPTCSRTSFDTRRRRRPLSLCSLRVSFLSRGESLPRAPGFRRPSSSSSSSSSVRDCLSSITGETLLVTDRR